jgi:hypothetical protein
MSVCSWGRIPERLIGDGSRGMTVDRGVGRSLGTISTRCAVGASGAVARGGEAAIAFCAGRGGGGRIVEDRDGRSCLSSLTLEYLAPALL